MKFLQTFWTGPSSADKSNLIGMKGGWLSCEYHWMSWALSCLQAKNLFGEINLVTDKKGKEILVDLLQLPYSQVTTQLEQVLDDYPSSVWALAKLYTYSMQTGAFLHLDGDVFLWKKPGDEWLSSVLVAQNLDKNLGLYRDTLNEINNQFTYIPSALRKENYEHRDIYASNAGLLGGNHPDFFKTYCRLAFDFIDKNKDDLNKLNTGNLNFIFEQYLFCQLAAEANIPVNYYKGMVDSPVFKDYIRFEAFPHEAMAHPVGGFKKYQHVCDHVAKKLRKDYPDYYYRIIELVCHSGVKMQSAIYHSPGLKLNWLSPASGQFTARSERQPAFERTQAAIDYLNARQLVPLPISLTTDAEPDDMLRQLASLLPEGHKRACLLDIYTLESEKNRLLENTYLKPANICTLYANDVSDYKQIQETFALPESELLKTNLLIAENHILLHLNWDWRYEVKEEIPKMAEKNFNEEKSVYPVLLLPHVLLGNVREYYLDELDMLVFETIGNTSNIEETLSAMEQYFACEEIEENYNPFKNLIFDTIKRLLYVGIVKINFKH